MHVSSVKRTAAMNVEQTRTHRRREVGGFFLLSVFFSLARCYRSRPIVCVLFLSRIAFFMFRRVDVAMIKALLRCFCVEIFGQG